MITNVKNAKRHLKHIKENRNRDTLKHLCLTQYSGFPLSILKKEICDTSGSTIRTRNTLDELQRFKLQVSEIPVVAGGNEKLWEQRYTLAQNAWVVWTPSKIKIKKN